jgi:hypothetical protein
VSSKRPHVTAALKEKEKKNAGQSTALFTHSDHVTNQSATNLITHNSMATQGKGEKKGEFK